MEKISLRVAVLADLPILLEFEQGVIKAERPYDEMLKPDPISYYDLKALIESPDSEVIVAVINEELVGSGYISIKKSKPYLKHALFGYLGFMFVKSEFRGKGINKKILERIIDWARIKDIKELRLNVYDDNASAIRAYEKVGFKKDLLNMRVEI